MIPEADILGRIIDPANPSLTPEAARALLQLGFADDDHARMAALARKSNDGTLTPDERRLLEGYVFVGDLLALLKSKARRSLDAA